MRTRWRHQSSNSVDQLQQLIQHDMQKARTVTSSGFVRLVW